MSTLYLDDVVLCACHRLYLLERKLLPSRSENSKRCELARQRIKDIPPGTVRIKIGILNDYQI